jgi:3-oxoacyl-[acyl-carrier protein] reductase
VQLTYSGKVALVIGGSSGIGLAVSHGLLEGGARVLIAARDADRLVSAAEELSREYEDDRVAWVAGDISVLGEADRMVDEAVRRFGRMDILVTTSARNYTCPVTETKAEDIEHVFRTNALGPLYAARAAALAFGPDGGRIITISATAARRGRPGRVAYSACKGAVEAMTRVLAVELASRGITANCVAAGLTDTPMLESDLRRDPVRFAQRIKETPMGRLGKPEEVAATVLFLASDEANWVSGQTIDAAGAYGV